MVTGSLIGPNFYCGEFLQSWCDANDLYSLPDVALNPKVNAVKLVLVAVMCI